MEALCSDLIVKEAVALAMAGLPLGAAAIHTEFDPTSGLAFINRIQIQQVIVNLVRNAIEAMASSETRELTITVARHGAGQIEISVLDTGSGLTPEVAATLFTPFVSTKPNGMGVGLSICRSIIEAHGWVLLGGRSRRRWNGLSFHCTGRGIFRLARISQTGVLRGSA
jgi:two-component system sensor kinase FixL